MNDAKDQLYREIRAFLWVSVAVMFLVMCVGVFGYMLVEGWSFLDSLYMTVITLASVGYSETHPLSMHGRVFTIVLIIAGVAALGNVVSQVARAFSEGYFLHGLTGRRKRRMLAEIRDHYIICGYGRIGQQICKDFTEEHARFVVIERNEQLVRQAAESGILVLHGDASSDDVLISAGIERARALLCALPSDAESLYVILSARQLNPKIFTIARVSSDEGAVKLKRVGTDQIVSPYLTGARRMAALALRPGVVDYIEAGHGGTAGVFIEQMVLPMDRNSSWVGKTLAQLNLRGTCGVSLLAIQRHRGEFIGMPRPETRLEPGDTLISMGSEDQLRKLNETLLPLPHDGPQRSG